MGNMVLGGYTFESNPSRMDGIIQKKKPTASVGTYTSVAFFSWPPTYEGQKKTLEWDYMSTAMYESLRVLNEADAEVVWDPQDGYGKTFNVQILDLNGNYFIHFENAAENHRTEAVLGLLIMSEV